MVAPWFARAFAPVADELLPCLLERLRGTPARLEERLAGVPAAVLTDTAHGGWSIQRNVGHLLDLDVLWRGRIDDFAAGAATLRPADLQNRATVEADHDAVPLASLLQAFRAARFELVAAIEALPATARAHAPLHPRLRQPMRLCDHVAFAAEHDDHHLARIGELLRRPRPDSAEPGTAPRLYFVIERFKPGCVEAVYRRFRERGRLAPPGLDYVASWVDTRFERCFQVMAAAEDGLLEAWIANWRDLVDFEVVPVRTSADAAAAMARR